VAVPSDQVRIMHASFHPSLPLCLSLNPLFDGVEYLYVFPVPHLLTSIVSCCAISREVSCASRFPEISHMCGILAVLGATAPAEVREKLVRLAKLYA